MLESSGPYYLLYSRVYLLIFCYNFYSGKKKKKTYCYISQNAGAKEAHAVSLHFAQIMYFGLFSGFIMAPVHCNLSQVIDLFHSFWKGRPLSFFQVCVALLAGFISVHYFRSVQVQRNSIGGIIFIILHATTSEIIQLKNINN